jgi:UDP-N-acetylglucosamine--N-acetylmuramyl-(pentapeptide) pyrophosphoryl-undecaprenol N-acetylglucosamine transferase
VSAVAYLPTVLPRAELTGAPVRKSIRNCLRDGVSGAKRVELGFPPDHPLVVVTGGSLGSALLNEIAERLRTESRDDISLLHLCGDRFFDVGGRNEQRRGDGSLRYLRLARSEDMSVVYAAADVVVMRAGASTIAEVATVGVASVIIPWKSAADDHQTLNARLLGDLGAAEVVAEGTETIDRVRDVVSRLLDDRNALTEMSRRARDAGALHRHPRFVEVIEAVAT